ncbi:Glucan 1,3-beta-glucosidase [Cordyceps militaris]|uniref:Glucan 1,3-beta-glucosidase n=1 Tax=Cordyceps militaris TaxID=73501 RepID=A0A2H4SM08_CORMI|nr:Glucan 1,3-beta-glucosidase [Cordyceps militaris]
MRINALAWSALLVFSAQTKASAREAHGGIDQTFAVIDNFVEEWKVKYPSLDKEKISDIHATAERMKDGLINPPPPPPRVTVPVSKPTDVPLPDTKPFGSLMTNGTSGPYSANSTKLERARQIVRQAQQEADTRNQERFANPRVNNYYHSHGSGAKRARALDNASLRINATVTAAAAILAEANEANATTVDHSKYALPLDIASKISQLDGDSYLAKRSPPGSKSFWMETITHDGRVPFGGSSTSGYKVFRNVKDYGAVADGKTDDTDAINKAMSDGKRCGADCGSSTIKPAIVYFPSGTYRVRQTIPMFYNTQVVGNPNDMPVILADRNFIGLGVCHLMSTLVAMEVRMSGTSTRSLTKFPKKNNFFRQVRNLIIDTTKVRMKGVAGLHWQVAQATSIYNVRFFGSTDRSKKHIGIFAENGSGGFMGDLVFSGTTIGIRCGNQQFSSHSLAFFNVGTAVDLLWDWGWTWKNIYIFNSDVGFNMNGDFMGGSMMLLDSHFEFVNLGISIGTQKGSTDQQEFSMTLENIAMTDVKTMAVHKASNTFLTGGSSKISSWMIGKVYDKANADGSFVKGQYSKMANRDQSLVMTNGVASNGYFIRRKPQYEDKPVDYFMTAHPTAKGDGVTDDSFALSLVAAVAMSKKIALYIPMGSYIVSQPILFPPGSVIVGECWSQIVAKGDRFGDASNPRQVVLVGNQGDTGSVEIQDLLVTVSGPTAGAILMEWNIAQDKQGSAAMWDVHFRIGGAAGSNLEASNCPKLSGSVNKKKCIAGSLMLHMTAKSSGYLENVWAWVADHELDGGPSQTQIDVYVARGILIESGKGPVWLYGTSSEHSVFYQYMLHDASNVVMSMIQTESPYYLPDPRAPEPFKQVARFGGDPDFSDCASSGPHCAAAWGLYILGSTNIHVYGAGLYNWFQRYTQPCVDSQNCQQRVVNVRNSGQVWLYNIYTIGTVEMINHETDKPILAKPNTNTNIHPFTSVINAWLRASTGHGSSDRDDDDDDDTKEYVSPVVCDALYTSLEQMEASYDHIQDRCISKYLAQAFARNLTSSREKYNKVINNDYPSKFKIYHDVIKEQSIYQIKKYMLDDKAVGWSCGRPQPKKCCNECSNSGGNYMDPVCFHLSCFGSDEGSRTKCSSGEDKKVACPTVVGDYPGRYHWDLDDKDKFFDNLEKHYGVLQGWVEFIDYDVHYNYGCVWGQTESDPRNMAQCAKDSDVFWTNYPALKHDFDLKDPSDIMKAAYDSVTRLIAETEIQMTAAADGFGSYADIASTLMLPAMSMSSAVKNMEGIVKIADQKIAQDREEGIATIITSIFFFIPFVGEAAAAVGVAVLRTIIDLAGAFADIGYSIYDSVKHPDDLMGNLFGMLFDAPVMGAAFRQIGKEWRAMKQEKIDTLPETFINDVKRTRKMQAMCNLPSTPIDGMEKFQRRGSLSTYLSGRVTKTSPAAFKRDEQRTAAVGVMSTIFAAASVTAYSTSTACLTLGHLYPRGTDVSVRANVELLLETLAAEATHTGEWVNVVGYVTSVGGGTAAVQALMVWPAGPMDVQQYEAALEDI